VKVLIDRKKGTFYPTAGFSTELKGLRYGFEESFYSLTLDHRRYMSVYGDHVLAYQFLFHTSAGEVPFQMMAELGGPEMMRGYFEGRYLDRCYAAGQVEYRFPVYRRLEGAAFFSAGSVAPEITGFEAHRIALAGGAGLRVIIDKNERVPIRLDFAINREGGMSFYLSLLQAF